MASNQPVWSKRVGEENLAARNIEYCAGFDVAPRAAADTRLAPYDLRTNAAHLIMLAEEKIIPAESAKALAKGLLSIRTRIDKGEDVVRPSCEDVHMSIETILAEEIGEEHSGHLHTARSRNDQVATDMRLWLRETIAHAAEETTALADAIARHARQHTETVCPGFTHGQPAMLTTWGHWTMSYLPRLLRDVRAFGTLLKDTVACPLGAAASYGTSWPINRARTAYLLGFQYPSTSGADAIWSRGEMEARFAFAAAQFMAHLSSIGQDLILLSTPPRLWLRLADEHTTGSSIMPQKRNPDFAEVTRARASVASSVSSALLGIGTALQSGYNRDTQWTKYLVFDAADNIDGAALLFGEVFSKVQVNTDAMEAACREGFLNATDVADLLARSRAIPFRKCYRIIGAAVRACEADGLLKREKMNTILEAESIAPFSEMEWSVIDDPRRLLEQRDQPGNPHPRETMLSIETMLGQIREESDEVAARTTRWKTADKELFEALQKLAG